MKKTIAAGLALLLLCSLAACSSKPSVSMADLTTFKHVETGVVLTLGMEKSEVDELLGEGTYFDWAALIQEKNPDRIATPPALTEAERGIMRYHYGTGDDHISLVYDYDKLSCMGFSAYDTETPHYGSSWQSGNAIGYGASQETLIETYGDPSYPIQAMQAGEYRFDSLVYYYDASGALIKDAANSVLTVEYFLDAESKTVLAHMVGLNETADLAVS